MLDGPTLLLYAGASLALLVVPGPSVLYVVALSVRQGRRAGIASVVGVGAGAYVHFVAAAAGLSALIAASATAFAVVKWAGAAYLVVLGVRTLLGRDGPVAPQGHLPVRSLWRVASQGTVVTILNPKLALFVLAFVPQFLDPARGSVAAQALLLGALFVGMAAVTDSFYALSAGWLGALMRRRAGAVLVQRWFTGGVYVALGVAAAAGHRPDGS
jgi:threonine/homoserine/homoserine lactone efflux protein